MYINVTKISDFVGELSEPELVQLLESFQDTLTVRQQELQHARDKHDSQKIAQLTHNLKSNALYFGADKLHEICLAGEMLFKSSDVTENDRAYWFDEFEAICQQVLLCIEQVLKEKRHDQKARE